MPDDGRSARRYERTSGRIPVDYVIDGHPRSDYVVSLSAGGVFVESKDPQPPGTTLRLRFRVPHRRDTVDVDGQVTWTNASDDPLDLQRPSGMAIRFDKAIDIATLATLIASLS